MKTQTATSSTRSRKTWLLWLAPLLIPVLWLVSRYYPQEVRVVNDWNSIGTYFYPDKQFDQLAKCIQRYPYAQTFYFNTYATGKTFHRTLFYERRLNQFSYIDYSFEGHGAMWSNVKDDDIIAVASALKAQTRVVDSKERKSIIQYAQLGDLAAKILKERGALVIKTWTPIL